MESYGIDMLGKFLVEKLSTLPAWGATDEGRLVYAEDADILYYGTSTTWVDYSSSTTTVSVADEGEIVLTVGVAGWGFAQIGDNEEWIQFGFTSTGIVTVISNSANAVDTDTDGNLCVYDAGSGVAIKNRLGSTKNIGYSVNYLS
jgi:hypothetical protein